MGGGLDPRKGLGPLRTATARGLAEAVASSRRRAGARWRSGSTGHFEGKKQVREAGRSPSPRPDTTQEQPPVAPHVTLTHSPFTSLACPPAIHIIGHFRREGGLRSSGQGEDPGPAEYHAGVDRRAAVLGALQGRKAVTPRAREGPRGHVCRAGLPVFLPFASPARPPAHLLSPLPVWPSKHLASGTLTPSPWEARA